MKKSKLSLSILFSSILLTSCSGFSGLKLDGKIHNLEDGLVLSTQSEVYYNYEYSTKIKLYGYDDEPWMEESESIQIKYQSLKDSKSNAIKIVTLSETVGSSYDSEEKTVETTKSKSQTEAIEVIMDVQGLHIKTSEKSEEDTDFLQYRGIYDESEAGILVDYGLSKLTVYKLKKVQMVERTKKVELKGKTTNEYVSHHSFDLKIKDIYTTYTPYNTTATGTNNFIGYVDTEGQFVYIDVHLGEEASAQKRADVIDEGSKTLVLDQVEKFPSVF